MDDGKREQGPLSSLVAALPRTGAKDQAVHERVLSVDSPNGAHLLFVCFQDPGGARALHSALRPRVEGSLLAELSRTATDLRETKTALASLLFVTFDVIPDLDDAIRAFGMERIDASSPPARIALARARGEAQAVGLDAPDDAHAIYEARVAAPTALAAAVHDELVRSTEEVFGESPGAPFMRLAKALAGAGGPRITPDLHGIDTLDVAIVSREERVVRFLPALVFQALCDGVAVAASRALGLDVEWAVAEPDADGLAPPPLVRVSRADGHAHVPVGLELLRFSVMPLQPGEAPPPLSDWVRSVLAG